MDASFWALVGLIIFVAVLVYYGVPGLIGKALDDRAERIRNDLDEARRLRDEAQQLLAEYQRKRKEAEQEAQDIVTAAKREADMLLAEAKQKSDDYVSRRTLLAEQKIAQAERDAVAEVRSRAVDIAIEAAGQVLARQVDSGKDASLFKAAVNEVKARLN